MSIMASGKQGRLGIGNFPLQSVKFALFFDSFGTIGSDSF